MTGFGQSRDRAERLVQLASALDFGTPRRLRELRDRFGLYDGKSDVAMRKQFERDKNDLADVGVVVETIDLGTEEPGYWIRRTRRSLALEPIELDALAILAATIADPMTGAAVAVMGAADDLYPGDGAPGRVAVDRFDLPAEVMRALREARRLEVVYRDAKGNETERVVEPWTLVHRRGFTYLVCWDVARQQDRNLRIDRILGQPVVGDPATQPRPADATGPVHPIELYDIEAVAPGPARFDAVEMGGSISGRQDGTVDVHFPDFRSEPVLAWAMRWGAALTAPDELVAEQRRRATRLVERHRGEPPTIERPPTPKARTATLGTERIRRLMVLPTWLAGRPGVTVDEVASAFGCDADDIRAELDLLDTVELAGHGAVGEVEVTDAGEVVYTRHLHRPEVEVSTADAFRLLVLLETLLPLLPDGLEQAEGMTALRARLRDLVPGDLRVEVFGDHHRELPLLRQAIAGRRAVRFEYRGRRDPEPRVRQVVPEQFRVANGALYLYATDVVTGEERGFRLDRMGPVEEVGEVPVIAAESVAPVYVPTAPEVEVVLLLDWPATWLLLHLTPVATADAGDGRTVAVVRTDAVDWLVGRVCSAGGTAEVVAPPEVRRAVADHAAPLAG